MNKLRIIGFISLFIALSFNVAGAVTPATSQVSGLCEVQAGGAYDVDHPYTEAEETEQTISSNLFIVNAMAEGHASADFGQSLAEIGMAVTSAQINTYNGTSRATFNATVQYHFEIQPIKAVPGTPPALLPVLFGARGQGYSQRVGYGFSRSKGEAYIYGTGLTYNDSTRFTFESYVVDETAYDPVDEEEQEDGFDGIKPLSLNANSQYGVIISASCELWAGPVGQDAAASAIGSAEVDPFIVFDQAAFNAMMGDDTFTLQEYYKLVFSDNLYGIMSQKQLQKSICILQKLIGLENECVCEDVNADGKIGLQEALSALQRAAELR